MSLTKMASKINSFDDKIKLPVTETISRFYQPQQNRKAIRILTVAVYVLCVSLAAIMLSLYYIFIWDPTVKPFFPKVTNCGKNNKIIIPEQIAIRLANHTDISADQFYKNILQYYQKTQRLHNRIELKDLMITSSSSVSSLLPSSSPLISSLILQKNISLSKNDLLENQKHPTQINETKIQSTSNLIDRLKLITPEFEMTTKATTTTESVTQTTNSELIKTNDMQRYNDNQLITNKKLSISMKTDSNNDNYVTKLNKINYNSLRNSLQFQNMKIINNDDEDYVDDDNNADESSGYYNKFIDLS